ncbi:hypothetical protein GALL_535120 [mine drainage metagenome]|uniref:Uncharacterized protein n=1 Tax=mine drainage metagenome TaxID=410659 RepID=A0A1J5P1F7_9ZZZZ
MKATQPSQSPAVEDASPVVEVESWTNGSYSRNYRLKWHRDVPEGTKLYATPQRCAVDIPEWMHPRTADLVLRFSSALAKKLGAAQRKYGYGDGWAENDWMDECREQLLEHVRKGDPRDVAAYCAFLWHHGERTDLPMHKHVDIGTLALSTDVAARQLAQLDGGIPGAEVVAYAMPGECRIEKVTNRDGRASWAVRRRSAVLNKQGEFEYEPLPSNRDDAFLQRCRFDSALEAANACREALQEDGGCAGQDPGRGDSGLGTPE